MILWNATCKMGSLFCFFLLFFYCKKRTWGVEFCWKKKGKRDRGRNTELMVWIYTQNVSRLFSLTFLFDFQSFYLFFVLKTSFEKQQKIMRKYLTRKVLWLWFFKGIFFFEIILKVKMFWLHFSSWNSIPNSNDQNAVFVLVNFRNLFLFFSCL